MFEVIKDADLRACLEFIIKIDNLKQVFRKTSPVGLDRPENTAEHSWHLIMMAILLRDTANKPIHLEKVIKTLAVHDLGEIGVNDTFLYDTDARQEAQAKEKASLLQLSTPLPSHLRDEVRSLWVEFSEGVSAEACYARSLDRFQPFLSNLANGGRLWQKEKITKAKALQRNEEIAQGSKILWEAYSALADKAEENSLFYR